MSDPAKRATACGPRRFRRDKTGRRISAVGLWHLALLVLLGTVWGGQFTILKVATVARLDEVTIVGVTLACQAVVYAALLCWKRAWFRPKWHHVRFFGISATLGFILPIGAAAVASVELSTGAIVFCEALTPMLTVVLVIVLRVHRPSRAGILAVVMATAGLVLVLWPTLSLASDGGLSPFVVAAIVPLSLALDGIYVARCWPEDLTALQIIAGEAICGALISLPVGLVVGLPELSAVRWDDGAWALVGLVATGIAEFYLYFMLLRSAGALFVSFACLISLATGIACGALFLGESHPPGFWAAVALLGIALVVLSRPQTGHLPASAAESSGATRAPLERDAKQTA